MIQIVVTPKRTSRTYRVQSAIDPEGGVESFAAEGVAQPGTGGAVVFVVTNGAPRRIYRTSVSIP